MVAPSLSISHLKNKFEELTTKDDPSDEDVAFARAISNELDRLRNADQLEKAPRRTTTADANVPRYSEPARPHAGNLRHFKGIVNGMQPEERAHRLGMWALARASTDVPSHYRFENAIDFANRNIASHGTTDSYGSSNLVPPEFGMDFIKLVEEQGVARNVAKVVMMNSDQRSDPKFVSGLTASFVGENSAASESNMQTQNITLVAKTLVVLTRISNQLNADATSVLGDAILGEFTRTIARTEDDCLINGDGSSSYAGIVGLLQALQTAAGNPTTTSAGGIVVGDGNAYSELTLANFHDTAAVLPTYADTGNTTWLASRNFYHSVMQKLELAAGGVTAHEIMAGDRRPRPMFLGYPVTFSPLMPSTAANSQLCVLLGDFSQGASFGDRMQQTILFSEHGSVGGESLFERNQLGIRATSRFDVVVHGTGSTTEAGPIVGLQTLNS